MSYIHSNNGVDNKISHRDIKPENLLIGKVSWQIWEAQVHKTFSDEHIIYSLEILRFFKTKSTKNFLKEPFAFRMAI